MARDGYWLLVLVIALAAYRLSEMLTWDDGPWDVFVRLRQMAGAGTGRATWLGRLLECPYCSSVWIAGLWAFWYCPTWPDALLVGLAASGGAAALLTVVGRR